MDLMNFPIFLGTCMSSAKFDTARCSKGFLEMQRSWMKKATRFFERVQRCRIYAFPSYKTHWSADLWHGNGRSFGMSRADLTDFSDGKVGWTLTDGSTPSLTRFVLVSWVNEKPPLDCLSLSMSIDDGRPVRSILSTFLFPHA